MNPGPRAAAFLSAAVVTVSGCWWLLAVPARSAEAPGVDCPGAQAEQPDFAPEGAVPVVDDDGNPRGTLVTCRYGNQGITIEALIPADPSHCPTDPSQSVGVEGGGEVGHARSALIAEIEDRCTPSSPGLGGLAAIAAASGLLFAVGVLASHHRRTRQPPSPTALTSTPDPQRLAGERRSLRRQRAELEAQLTGTAAAARRQAEIAAFTTGARGIAMTADPREGAEAALTGLLATQRRVGQALRRLTDRESGEPTALPQPLTNTDLIRELRNASTGAVGLSATVTASHRQIAGRTARIAELDSRLAALPVPEETR